jgi:hypothetical protein
MLGGATNTDSHYLVQIASDWLCDPIQFNFSFTAVKEARMASGVQHSQNMCFERIGLKWRASLKVM